MTDILYISQLGSAASAGSTDIFPVTQGSTGPATGTTRKITLAQIFTSPTFTGVATAAALTVTGLTTLGSGSANSLIISGGATGAPVLLSVIGSDASAGLGLLPDNLYATTTPKLFVMPQSLWAAAQTSNSTRPRTQFAVATPSFVNLTATDFYPQVSITAGSQSGVVDQGSRIGNVIMTVDNDNVVTVAGGPGPEGLSMLYIGMGVGNASGAAGGASAGGRVGSNANIFINSDVDVGAGTIFHVAVAGNTTAYRRMGGVPGSHRGNVFGSLLAARAQNLGGTGPGPRYLNSIVGLEVDTEQQANVTALWKMGVQIVDEKDTAANALQQNIGLGFINQPSASTIGWDQVISFSGYNGQPSVAPNGQLIASVPSPIGLSSFAAADGMNLARFAFSRAAIETPGLYVDGSGNTGGQTVGGLALQTVSAVNAKVSTVASVTVVEGGVFDGGNPAPMPTFALASPATSGGVAGVTATMTVTNMAAIGFTGVATGGNGAYVAGETLTALTGTGTAFTIYIETVTAGVPTNIRIATAGDYTVLPTNPVSFTGSAAGTGFTLGMRWTVLAASRTAGTNYNELRPPAVTYTGLMTQTKEARFKVVMSAGTAVDLVLNSGATTRATNLAVGDGTARQTFAHSSHISPVAGLMSTAPFSLAGNAFGTVTSGAAFFRQFNVNADTVDASAATGGGVNVNYFGHTISAGAVGGRTTFSAFMSQQGITTSAVGQFYVAGACFGEAAYSAGGTAGAGNARGNLFATNHSARLKTGGGLYWNSLVGEEVDVSVQASTSVVYKVGFKVVQWVDDAVSGTVADYAIGIGNQVSGTAPGWDFGFAVGAPEAWWPIKSTGTIHGTYAATTGGGPAMAAAYGIDYSAVAFSSGFLRSTGFLVDGSGNTTANSFIVGTGGPTWTKGTGVPATTTPRGSLFSRTDGAVGSTLYVSQGGGTWNAVALV